MGRVRSRRPDERNLTRCGSPSGSASGGGERSAKTLRGFRPRAVDPPRLDWAIEARLYGGRKHHAAAITDAEPSVEPAGTPGFAVHWAARDRTRPPVARRQLALIVTTLSERLVLATTVGPRWQDGKTSWRNGLASADRSSPTPS